MDSPKYEFNKAFADKVYRHFKKGAGPGRGNTPYEEEMHCKMLIEVMCDENKGTVGSFCVKAFIGETTFNRWVKEHELFREIYSYSKMIARELWEEQGRILKNREYPMGIVDYSFEHWKMIGWQRFGVSRTSRLKLNLKSEDSPLEHYKQIIMQANEGDFTASEFKQLMESVNVGLNVHNSSELQKQIDELKSDLDTMTMNANVQNPFTNKGIA